jgi:hypothetical protein
METVQGDESLLPRVIACGYRVIRIPKSGVTFPAFLCSWPGLANPVWRSKRDFLLLNRASKHDLPKAALKKLAEQAPWKRPGTKLECDVDRYQPTMKKSLMLLDQFLQKAFQQATIDGLVDMRLAWDVFGRPMDTDNLMDPNSEQDLDASQDPSTTQTGSQLGQYFCTSENANRVVHLALEKLGQQDLNDDKRQLVFVEPSCGYGDVIEALVSRLAQSNIAANRVSIIAFDIDPNAIEKSRGRQLTNSTYSISFHCQDFLSSRRPVECTDRRVVVVGGPPYTTGQGSQANIQRDLPARFVHHSMEEWGASVVSFLMPSRYQKEALVAGRRSETVELDSSTFFFQGETPVTQPSIIQCYY